MFQSFLCAIFLKMSRRQTLFTHPLTNATDFVPFDRTFAMRIGYLKYRGEHCERHHNEYRHTISGNCIDCDAERLATQFAQLVDPPLNAEAGLLLGQTWYYSTAEGVMCRVCGGFSRRHYKTFRCVSCQEARRTLVALSMPPKAPKPPKPPRQPTAAGLLMAGAPDMVISRDDARALGFKVFRTGKACGRGHTTWRYVATGGCLECK